MALALVDELVVGPLLLGGHFLYSHGTGVTAIDVRHPAAPRLAATFGGPVPGTPPEAPPRVPALWPTNDALFALLVDPTTLRTRSVVLELPR